VVHNTSLQLGLCQEQPIYPGLLLEEGVETLPFYRRKILQPRKDTSGYKLEDLI
jgi:hypothetical protein